MQRLKCLQNLYLLLPQSTEYMHLPSIRVPLSATQLSDDNTLNLFLSASADEMREAELGQTLSAEKKTLYGNFPHVAAY